MYVSLNWTVNLLHENFCEAVLWNIRKTLSHFFFDHIPKEAFSKGSILRKKLYSFQFYNAMLRDITRAQKLQLKHSKTQSFITIKLLLRIPKDILSHIMISILSPKGHSKLDSFWVSLSALSYDARGRNRNVNYGGSQTGSVRHTDITDTERSGRQTDRSSGNNWPLIFTFVTRVTFPSELEAWQLYCPADCTLPARRDKAPSW